MKVRLPGVKTPNNSSLNSTVASECLYYCGYGVDNHVENKPYPRPPDILEMSMSLGAVVSLIHHCHMLVQTLVQTDHITTIS
jgi:hypothetical protein